MRSESPKRLFQLKSNNIGMPKIQNKENVQDNLRVSTVKEERPQFTEFNIDNHSDSEADKDMYENLSPSKKP